MIIIATDIISAEAVSTAEGSQRRGREECGEGTEMKKTSRLRGPLL